MNDLEDTYELKVSTTGKIHIVERQYAPWTVCGRDSTPWRDLSAQDVHNYYAWNGDEDRDPKCTDCDWTRSGYCGVIPGIMHERKQSS